MRKSKTVVLKKRGRPAKGGRDPHIAARMPPALIASVEMWAAANETSRSDAFRRLVEFGLKQKREVKPVSKPGRRQRAQELATEAIEKISDRSAAPEERAQRRCRLTKGPSEFREDRVDQPKPKAT